MFTQAKQSKDMQNTEVHNSILTDQKVPFKGSASQQDELTALSMALSGRTIPVGFSVGCTLGNLLAVPVKRERYNSI
ncbi:hypothetical protein YC2023_001198 [Brassica napus]